MEEIENKAKTELISFYSYYCKNGVDENLKNLAKILQRRYLNASTLLSEEVNLAINRLVDFYVDTGIKYLSKEEAEKVIRKLKT